MDKFALVYKFQSKKSNAATHSAKKSTAKIKSQIF